MPTNDGIPEESYRNRNRFVAQSELAKIRNKALGAKAPVTISDPEVDLEWAKYHYNTRAPKSYYDYYYSGADMRVYVAELGDDNEFGDLPIVMMGFNIEQQKMPVYGFWDYTYSAVMRGQRLVSGQIAIAPKYPGYMKKVLAAAANNRALNDENLLDPYPRAQTITEDDNNINKYWGRNLDPAALVQGANEYSVHPPFNLVVVFGVQDTSVEVSNDPNSTFNFSDYGIDAALYSDHNQRLVEGFDPNTPTRYILEACELTGMNTQYGSSGEVIYEMYNFFARDLIVPPAGYRPPQTQAATPPPTPMRGGV